MSFAQIMRVRPERASQSRWHDAFHGIGAARHQTAEIRPHHAERARSNGERVFSEA
jgi:hypothetical protein